MLQHLNQNDGRFAHILLIIAFRLTTSNNPLTIIHLGGKKKVEASSKALNPIAYTAEQLPLKGAFCIYPLIYKKKHFLNLDLGKLKERSCEYH